MDSSKLVGENLSICYDSSEEPVVECDSVVLPAGEFTALVGPNGSGKSTLLKSLSNQLPPAQGHVRLDGKSIANLDTRELARQLGMLSQENEAPSRLTVGDLVAHGRYPHRGTFEGLSAADREAIDRALSLAGVSHLRDREMGALSGGQKQLVWIALVLAQETDVLLLDEPTTYLDLHHQLRILELLRELTRTRGLTVGVVLHDISQAAQYADNLIAMRDGELYDWGPAGDVVTEQLLADVFKVEATVSQNGSGGPHVQPHRPFD